VAVSNHVFTCARCTRQFTVHSASKLECFFVGLCYWCIIECHLTQEQIVTKLQELLPRPILIERSDGTWEHR